MSNGSVGRRLGRRTSLTQPAKILDSSGCVIDVKIKDVSVSGVRVEAAIGAPIPKQFIFRFSREKRDVPAELVWRKGDEIGIRFIEEEDARVVKPPPVSVVAPKIALSTLRSLAKGQRR